MKVFTKITNQFSACATLMLLVLVLGSLGCKREIQKPEVADPNELTLTAAKPVPIESASAAPSRATIEEFTTGSAIGLFVQLRSEAVGGSDVVLKSNSHYRYDQPVWQPASKEDKLLYHETDPVYVFGYYPHPSMPGAPTSIVAGSSIVNYALPKDQSVDNDVKVADLLWAGANNEGLGYMRQRLPVNLLFQHQLCKVSFYIKLIDSKPGANTESVVNLRSLAAVGSQISTKAQLNVLKGVLSPTYETNHFDSVRWESQAASGMELTVGAGAVHVADLLMIPFVAAQSKNWFRYVLHYPLSDVYQSFTAAIPVYDPAATGGASSMLCFESNKHNKVTVTIDVSSAYVTITADIEEWAQGSESDLPAEPE